MSDNRRSAGWIFFAAIVVFCMTVLSVIIGAAISSLHAEGVGTCTPFGAGIDAVLKEAQASHSSVAIIPPPAMSGFLAGLGDKGKGIIGESALVMFTPPHKVVVFVKRGDALCVAISDDGGKPADVDL